LSKFHKFYVIWLFVVNSWSLKLFDVIGVIACDANLGNVELFGELWIYSLIWMAMGFICTAW